MPGSCDAVLFSLAPRLPAEQVGLHVCNPVQKQDSVQVIQLVLEDDGLKAFGCHVQRLAIQTERPDGHACGAADVAGILWDAETSLAEEHLASPGDDLGIEQDEAALCAARVADAASRIHDGD